MDILKLRYFKAVAQTEHMSKAAEKLHITQPALSKTIALLEEELGVPLFHRVGRQIQLSENGKIFLKYAEQAIGALETGIRSMKATGDSFHGSIKFQTNITGDRYLVDLVKGFKARYPQSRFEIIKNYTKSKFQNDCDLYIHADRIPMYKCVSIPVFSEEIVLGVPRGHRLGALSHISLGRAEDEPFVMLMRSTSWYDEVEAFCAESGFRPNVIYECDGCEMIAKLIAAGEGVGFLPSKSWGDHPSGVVLLHLDNVECRRNYNLSWPIDKERSFLVSEFIEYTRRFFEGT